MEVLMEVVSQADTFGLPERNTPPAPPAEKVADQLRAPQPWQGPTRVETNE